MSIIVFLICHTSCSRSFFTESSTVFCIGAFSAPSLWSQGRFLPLSGAGIFLFLTAVSHLLLLPPWSTSFKPNIGSPGKVQASPPRLWFSRQCLKEKNIHLERPAEKDIISYATERSDNKVPLSFRVRT